MSAEDVAVIQPVSHAKHVPAKGLGPKVAGSSVGLSRLAVSPPSRSSPNRIEFL